jgi:hypothetical protein
MAISFIANAFSSAANGGAVTVTLPGGMATNDLIMVAAACGDDDNLDHDIVLTTAGYTEVADLFGNGTQDANLGVFYKYHNGTDTTVVMTAVGGTDAANGTVVSVFRGVALAADGGPFTVTSATVTGTTGGNPDPPSLDHPGTAGTWTVIAIATASLAGGFYTFPTGYDVNGVEATAADTTDITVAMSSNGSPADPENPAAVTFGGTGTGWAAVTMALKPAGAGGGVTMPPTPMVKLQAVNRSYRY